MYKKPTDPEVIKDDIPILCETLNSRLYKACERKLNTFKILDKCENILFHGVGDGEFFINVFLPKLPENVKTVVGTCTSENAIFEILTKNKDVLIEMGKKRVIDIIEFDLISEEDYDIDKFDSIVSFYDQGIALNSSLAYQRLKDLMNDKACAIFVFETRSYFFEALYRMSLLSPWSEYLKDLRAGIPKTFFDFATNMNELMSKDSMIVNFKYFEEEFIEYDDFNSLVGVFDEIYTLGEYIPADKIYEFYQLLYAETLHLARANNERVDEDHPKVVFPLTTTTFVIPNFI